MTSSARLVCLIIRRSVSNVHVNACVNCMRACAHADVATQQKRRDAARIHSMRRMMHVCVHVCTVSSAIGEKTGTTTPQQTRDKRMRHTTMDKLQRE